jgi:hypothetical protein
LFLEKIFQMVHPHSRNGCSCEARLFRWVAGG